MRQRSLLPAVQELTETSVKGCLDPVIPTDPLIYHFYEIMQVYGMPLKAVIQEKFIDGIMSAIDFPMDIEKEDPTKGDRVKVIMSGKLLNGIWEILKLRRKCHRG